jgi:alpha-mannosidase
MHITDSHSSARGKELHKSYPLHAAAPVGKPIPHIQTDRLPSFTSTGQYESQNLLSMLDHGRVAGGTNVKLFVNSIPNLARVTFEEATKDQTAFVPTQTGEAFGPSWATHWFRIHVIIPAQFLGEDHLEFHWDARNEGLVWTEDGVPLQGLTGGGRDQRTEWIFPEAWRDGGEHIFYIEMACNKIMGNASGDDDNQPPAPDTYFRLLKADIVAVNVEARSLLIDFNMISDAARQFANDSWESHQALQIANSIMDTFRPGSQASIVQCRKLAQSFLGSTLNSPKVYHSGTKPIVYGIGHCHIGKVFVFLQICLRADQHRYMLVMALGRNQAQGSPFLGQSV